MMTTPLRVVLQPWGFSGPRCRSASELFMEKSRDFLFTQGDVRAETMLDRAVRQELKRRDLMRAVCSSHRTAGTSPLPSEAPKKQLQ